MAYSLGSISPAMPSSSLPPVGARVVILYNRKQVPGTVRFAGITNFASGALVGVALDYPIGKNDGTVERVKYFECEAKHGLFVRPQAILSMMPPTDMNISQATSSASKPKKVSSKGSSKGRRRSGGRQLQEDFSQKDDTINQTIRPAGVATLDLGGRRLNEFWEAIGGNISQDVRQRADKWFDEQGAESLDDVIRYRLGDSFVQALQLKLVQKKKATEYFENSGCGNDFDGESKVSSTRSGAIPSPERQNPRRSAVFADMLAPVLAPHGYSDAQVRDVVKQYESEMAPLLDSPRGASPIDSGETAKRVIPSLLKSDSSCPDWQKVLREIHSVVARLAESAAAAEKQAITAQKEAELIASPRDREKEDGPSQMWLNEIAERLDRVERNVQESADFANDAFGKFEDKVRDAMQRDARGNLSTPLKDMRGKPGSVFEDDGPLGSPIVAAESFSTPSTAFPSTMDKSLQSPRVSSSSLVHQGPLVVSRNGGLLWRSFVLYMDRLEYFAPSGDSPQGLRLERKINFDDIKRLSIRQDSFEFFLHDGNMKLSTSGADEKERTADIAKWAQAFGKALYFSVDASETKLDWQSPLAEKTVRKQVFRQPDSKNKVSCRGYLGVVQQAPAAIACITLSKFFVLDGEALEYYADADSKKPVGRIDLANIAAVEREEPEMLCIYVYSIPKSTNNGCLCLKLYAPERDEYQRWDDAWQSLLIASTWETLSGATQPANPLTEQPVRTSTQTSGKESKPFLDWSSAVQAHSPAGSPNGSSLLSPGNSSSSAGNPMPGARSSSSTAGNPMPGALCQGILGVRTGLSEKRQHCVLYADRMDVLTEGTMKPQWEVLVSSVESVNALQNSSGFCVQLANGKPKMLLMLDAADAGMFPKWMTSWETVLSQKVVEQPRVATKVIFQGNLEVLKKDQNSGGWRHFVLSEESISYFSTKESFLVGDEPKGTIRLDDIVGMDVLEDCFNIKTKEGTLNLRAKSPEEFEQWKNAWREVLTSDASEDSDSSLRRREALQKGLLGVVRRDGIRWQYFVLLDDCMENYADVSEYDRGMTCKGRVRYDDMAKFVVGEYMLSIHIGNGKMQLQAESASTFDSWVASWKQVLRAARPDLLVEDDSTTKDPAPKSVAGKPFSNTSEDVSTARDPAPTSVVAKPFSNTPEDDLITKDPVPSTLEKEAPAVAPKSEPDTVAGSFLHRGPLKRMGKNGGVETYFVLYADRLEYFASEEQSKQGSPSGIILSSDITNLKNSEEELSFTIYIAKGKLALSASTLDDFTKWTTEMQKVVSIAPQRAVSQISANPGRGEARIQGLLTRLAKNGGTSETYFVLYDDRLEYFQSEEQSKLGKAGQNIKVADITHVEFDESDTSFTLRVGQGKLKLRTEGREELSNWRSELEKLVSVSSGGEPEPLCQGQFEIVKSDTSLSRWFVLFQDRLEYCSSEEAFTSGSEAAKQVPMSNISAVESSSDSFFIRTADNKRLEIRIENIGGLAKWKSAWNKVGKLTSAKASASEKKSNKTSESNSDGVIKKGMLNLDFGSRYCVLTQDEFKYYLTGEDYENGDEARQVVAIDAFDDLERFPPSVGFDIILPNETIKLRTDSVNNYNSWNAAWSEIFVVEQNA